MDLRNEIDLFRRNLFIYRLILGWSAEKMAHKLGISRSTIVHIENREMSLLQYYAIKYLIDHETQFDNLLKETVEYLSSPNYTEGDKEILRNMAREKLKCGGKKLGMIRLQKMFRPEVEKFLKAVREKERWDMWKKGLPIPFLSSSSS